MEQIKYTTALPLDFALPQPEQKTSPRKARA